MSGSYVNPVMILFLWVNRSTLSNFSIRFNFSLGSGSSVDTLYIAILSTSGVETHNMLEPIEKCVGVTDGFDLLRFGAAL